MGGSSRRASGSPQGVGGPGLEDTDTERKSNQIEDLFMYKC